MVVVLFLHLWFRTILPYPYFTLNLICGAAILALIIKPSFDVLWFIIAISTLENAFSSEIFIINILSLTVSFALLRWLMLNVFTNKSVLITIFLTLSLFFFYRLLFFILTFLNYRLLNADAIDYNLYLQRFVMEALTTTILVIIGHLVGKLFFKNLRPEFITVKKNIYGF